MRIRIIFSKTEAMRYTGHLDLFRAWERAFRRARLPLAYSQGFNPRPRMTLASALPLGFTSQAEVLDARLEENLPIEAIHSALSPKLPPGIALSEIQEVELKAPSLQSELQAAEFLITFLEPLPQLESRLAQVLNTEQILRVRRKKEYDLRPLILALEILSNQPDGLQRLFARLSAQAGATGRPEEVIDALGASAETCRVHRTRLIFQAERPDPSA
ncbi:TIGR03936 family radical SAM-associated protein [Chloroflexota bacterium]